MRECLVREKEWEKVKYNLNKNKPLQEMVLVTSKNHKNETLEKVIKKFNLMIITMGI